MPQFSYEVIPGFFVNDSDKKSELLQQVLPRFGLIDASSDRWVTFKARVAELNSAASEETSYKVLFLGRHGQGFHNTVESIYGTEEWNRKWARLNGDGNIVWGPDPKLTELGIEQAKTAHNAWIEELKAGIPLPESLYSSPFNRAIHTALITFDGILINMPEGQQKRPLIKELLREMNGVHTCDKRGPRSLIEETFPEFDIEPGLSEDDLLWQEDHRETEEEITSRLQEALADIFSHESATYISITAHSGTLRALMRVINAAPRPLPTGGVLAFVVKVTKV
ncbi:hypothetical protein M422DRAFT_36152 [Sphaerobolus stellatus SS14]|uniref:Phosphoglycerate mutase n=1 Tax=Sphaerobolus stellatus (strain SS14) TaxID=990650 RepID=A0A0C9V2F0_SPHS4|nr:hypothetical protein M422DRAFT_36152 [Sphaerobolus stellatus SS14]